MTMFEAISGACSRYQARIVPRSASLESALNPYMTAHIVHRTQPTSTLELKTTCNRVATCANRDALNWGLLFVFPFESRPKRRRKNPYQNNAKRLQDRGPPHPTQNIGEISHTESKAVDSGTYLATNGTREGLQKFVKRVTLSLAKAR